MSPTARPRRPPHGGGHAGELLLLRQRQERDEKERGEAAREVIGCGGHNLEFL
jgi:hypothetical protein